MFVLIGIVILLSSLISAFAVSTKYYPGYPLKMMPGDSKDVQIILQNRGNTEDVSVRAEVSAGSDIMNLLDEDKIYTIPAGGKLEVDMIINVPLEAIPDTEYPMNIKFTTITSSEEGQTMGFGQSIGQNFQVLVVETFDAPIQEAPEEGAKSTIYIIIGIVLVLAIIAVFSIRKKKSIENPQK